MLIPFPIAFLTGSLIADVAAFFTGRPIFNEVSFWIQIAGIAFALLAAIPGIIDFIYTVPPDSTAKTRAAKHGVLNITAVSIFAAVWFYRQSSAASQLIIISAELVGFILMCIAGWMGGTLIHRNQIGVDPRYANKGKWKEAYFKEGNGEIEVASIEELQVNQMKLLHVGSARIVLARTENSYVAFDDRCTHRGGSLAGGSMTCGTVHCPWHGSQFKVSDGSVAAGPAEEKIKVYEVIEKEGRVYLRLPAK